MSDPTGQFEMLIFAEVLAQYRGLLDSGMPLLVVVEVQALPDKYRLICQSAQDLDKALGMVDSCIEVVIENETPLPRLRDLLQQGGTGRGQVNLLVPLDKKRVAEIRLSERYALSARSRAAIRALPGILNVNES
jgi:DNA polymerase-3 subunit alpha